MSSKKAVINPSSHPNKRISRELKTIQLMIKMYCHHHHVKNDICEQCNQLIDYSIDKTLNCKFGADKPACSSCPVHCYKPSRREEIRKVMRYSGPRIIFIHPYLAITHMIDKYLNKSKSSIS